MFQYKIKCLFPRDINENKDIFLGETSVQITGFHGYPSVHLVKSYMLSDGHDVERDEGSHYHIFEFKCGTTAINYSQREFEQMKKFIALNEHWNVFYKHDTDDFFIPIPKENFLPSR
ncbi:hypothetical protein [Peribacillus frigoritolerans]|uniref:hypothetical protein n=1 Tax=Peribacillus frigoritolerans TaxID=450367 RepID=UPI0039A31340